MKIYAYYKNIGLPIKLLQYGLLVNLCLQVFIRLLHFYSPILDQLFFNNPNTHIGGAKYTNSIYVPISNKLILNSIPDVRLYKLFIPHIVNNKLIFMSRFLSSLFIRLSDCATDLKTCSRKRTFYIYDLHPTLVLSKVPALLTFLPRTIAFNHTIMINSKEDYLQYKLMIHEITPDKIGKIITRVRFNWPLTGKELYLLLIKDTLVADSLGRISSLFSLILDNGHNMLYNIIEGMKKYYYLKSMNKSSVAHYILNDNKYHLCCNAFQDYTMYLMNGRLITFLAFCQIKNYLVKLIKHQLLLMNADLLLINYILGGGYYD